MNLEDHPRGLNPQDRAEFNQIGDRLLELYDKMPGGVTKACVVAAGDGIGNCLFLFKGSEEEIFKLRAFLEMIL